jgi:ribosomal protein S17E
MKEDDDFAEEFQGWDQETQDEEKIRDEFVSSLAPILFDKVSEHPDMVTKDDGKLNGMILKACIKTSHEVLDCYKIISDDYRNNKISELVTSQPKRKTRADAEIQLKNTIKKLKPELTERYKKEFWATFEEDIPYENFEWETFDLIKETLVDFFYDEIVNFEPSHFLKLDSYCYFNGMLGFIERMYDAFRKFNNEKDNA